MEFFVMGIFSMFVIVIFLAFWLLLVPFILVAVLACFGLHISFWVCVGIMFLVLVLKSMLS